MFRSTGILLVAAILVTSTALAQQRSYSPETASPRGTRLLYRAPRYDGYRPPGAWNQPAPAVVVAPLLGLLPLLQMLQPVVVAPAVVPAGPPPGYRDRHDARPDRVAAPARPPGGYNQPGPDQSGLSPTR
jgi:hypothetical protein